MITGEVWERIKDGQHYKVKTVNTYSHSGYLENVKTKRWHQVYTETLQSKYRRVDPKEAKCD